MGNSSSYSQRRNEISQKIHEKNLVYIAMNDEIKEALETKDPETVKKLMSEIAAHMIELQQIKALELSNIERGRSQKIFKNFEIALASLKSVLIQEGPTMQQQSSSQFYCEHSSEIKPDIVSGLIHLDNCDSMCRRFPSSINERSTESRSNSSTVSEYVQFENDLSLDKKGSHTIESVLQSVVSEFDFLMDKLHRPINDVDEYYQIDKGVLFLQLQLNSIELPDNSPLYVTKFKLLEQLESFRSILDQKSGELEEQQQLSKEVNTLELKLDSAVTEQELSSLSTRAQLLQETIEKGFWDDHLAEKKVEILRRLSDILVKIAYMRNAIKPKPSESLYENLISLQNTNDIKEQDELECIQSIDRVLEEETQKHNLNSNESLYANVVVRCKSEVEMKPRVRRTSSNSSQRGTVYINADIVRQNSTCENLKTSPSNVQKYLEPINKRPLPLPRNYEEKVISDLPKQWKRLNKILNSEYISDAEKSEVAEIRKQAEVAKNLFERKIRNIMEKLQESVEL